MQQKPVRYRSARGMAFVSPAISVSEMPSLTLYACLSTVYPRDVKYSRRGGRMRIRRRPLSPSRAPQLALNLADDTAIQGSRKTFVACCHDERRLPCPLLHERMARNVGSSRQTFEHGKCRGGVGAAGKVRALALCASSRRKPPPSHGSRFPSFVREDFQLDIF